MADIVVATCAGGAAQLVFEVDVVGVVTAIRLESTVSASVDIELTVGGPRTFDLRPGTRRIDLPVPSRFVLDSPTSPIVAIGLRAIH